MGLDPGVGFCTRESSFKYGRKSLSGCVFLGGFNVNPSFVDFSWSDRKSFLVEGELRMRSHNFDILRYSR